MGELLANAARVPTATAIHGCGEWSVTPDALWTTACEAQSVGRWISALAHYRRAATCHATRARTLAPTTRMLGSRRRPPPGSRERIEIAYENTDLPGTSFGRPTRRSTSAGPGDSQQPQRRRHLADVGPSRCGCQRMLFAPAGWSGRTRRVGCGSERAVSGLAPFSTTVERFGS